MNAPEVLDLIADMKRAAQAPEVRRHCDSMAVGIITQDIEPQKMADNLNYWLELTKTLTPIKPPSEFEQRFDAEPSWVKRQSMFATDHAQRQQANA